VSQPHPGLPPAAEGHYRWFVLANVMIGTFMAVLDATIVNVGLASIMASFGTTVDTIQWVITAYMLVSTVLLPSSGWFADHLGYKRTYIVALALFTAGSLLCGLAWSERSLIAFRVVQGVGAGLLMPVGMAIVTREFPPQQRGMVLGFWGIAAAASISLGPLVGGYLIDNLGWRAIFTVNVPIGIVGLAVTAAVQREHKLGGSAAFDVPGFVSMVVFLGGLLLALSAGNAQWNSGGWTSTYVLTCFAASAVGLLVFLTRELTAEHPLIELRLLRIPTFAIMNVILFLFGVGMFGSTFLMPLYLQNALGYTALQTGALFLPVGLLQGFLSPAAGLLSDRVSARMPAFVGVVLLGASLVLNAQLSLDTEHRWLVGVLCLRGVGAGFAFTPLSAIALSEIPREKMAQASGMFNVIRQVGGSVGIAILGAVEAGRMAMHVAMYGQAIDPAAPAVRSVLGALQAHALHAAGSGVATAATQARSLLFGRLTTEAFVAAVDDCFLIAGLITLVGVIPILLVRVHRRERAAAAPAAAE
jgi:MFS transporter, DHA2 family, multidrug resistance protein